MFGKKKLLETAIISAIPFDDFTHSNIK